MGYINSTTRQKLDASIEALAQAVAKNSREGVAEYSVAGNVQYAIFKLVARVLKLTYKEVNYNSTAAFEGALANAQSEFHRRVVEPFYEKQKNLNGEVFGEVL